ncbi:MAG: winged helix-turn-helix transcriptional regulator [Solirubrobacteraceae bacterium]
MSPAPAPKRHPYDQWSPDARALDIVGDKWTLLIVRDLAAGTRRFVELQRVLPGISTEQLRSRLNRMVAAGLLTRQRYREVPPRVEYELTARSRDLLPVLGSLARWGYDWAWSAPREYETIDIGAILRIAPGLVTAPSTVSGVAHAAVVVDEEITAHYCLTVTQGAVTIAEHEPEHADCRIRGAQQDWIDAFGPGADIDALRITGDERLATILVEGIGAYGLRRAHAA